VLPETGDGVVVAKGGTGHGFSLFVKGWRPGFAVRVNSKMHVAWAKRRLERGRWAHLAGILTEDKRLLILVNGEVSGEAKAGGQSVQVAGIPVIEHCEDNSLAAGGLLHAGTVAGRLGLPGQPSAAEARIAARDLLLAAETGHPVHLQHVSTKETVEILCRARERGITVHVMSAGGVSTSVT
jgi:hypothetical protein